MGERVSHLSLLRDSADLLDDLLSSSLFLCSLIHFSKVERLVVPLRDYFEGFDICDEVCFPSPSPLYSLS